MRRRLPRLYRSRLGARRDRPRGGEGGANLPALKDTGARCDGI